MDNQLSSGSPSMQATKRRHTSTFGPASSASPERRAKRTKTLKTYGAKRQSLETEDESFERLRDDSVAGAPGTSQSVRFSDHSAGELPPGSMQADFANHEPAVLFRDSGITVADTSSAQQKLLQQALGNTKGLSTSAVSAVQSEEQPSSGFPWSANELVHSAKSTGVPDEQPSGATIGEITAEDIENGGIDDRLQDNTAAEQMSQNNPPRQLSQSGPLESTPKVQHSPSVEVYVEEDQAHVPSRKEPASTQKSTKGRKRKIEQDNDTDPLNSDDRIIGLPKERYQPRPSRRRATQVVEEPIDFSVRPERAAKVKRSKTTHAGAGFAVEEERGFSLDAKSSADKTAADSAPKSSKGKKQPDEQTPAKEPGRNATGFEGAIQDTESQQIAERPSDSALGGSIDSSAAG